MPRHMYIQTYIRTYICTCIHTCVCTLILYIRTYVCTYCTYSTHNCHWVIWGYYMTGSKSSLCAYHQVCAGRIWDKHWTSLLQRGISVVPTYNTTHIVTVHIQHIYNACVDTDSTLVTFNIQCRKLVKMVFEHSWKCHFLRQHTNITKRPVQYIKLNL